MIIICVIENSNNEFKFFYVEKYVIIISNLYEQMEGNEYMENIHRYNGSSLDTSKLIFLNDKGSEFNVYRYDDFVVKIYKDNYKLTHLSLEELKIFKSILTKRILLPSDFLLNNNDELIGYMMPYIDGEKNLLYDSVSNLFNELAVLKEDLDSLSSNLIILKDINIENTIYNGNLYLIDPGNYAINQLEGIIFHVEIEDTKLSNELTKIAINSEYHKLRELINSLTKQEKEKIIKTWNYEKINKLMHMMMFSKIENIDPYTFRQIVQFIISERKKNKFTYDLDILKIYLNEELTIADAVDEFVKNNIMDNIKEKELYKRFINL